MNGILYLQNKGNRIYFYTYSNAHILRDLAPHMKITGHPSANHIIFGTNLWDYSLQKFLSMSSVTHIVCNKVMRD